MSVASATAIGLLVLASDCLWQDTVYSQSAVCDNIPRPTGYIPGAAAPGYSWWRTWQISILGRAAVGLERTPSRQSMKKSIWWIRSFSRWFLKELMLGASTPSELMLGASTGSWARLFHRLILRWEKRWKRISDWLCVFLGLQLCPRVMLVSDRVKKWDQDTAEKSLTILKSSIKSALFRRSSSDRNPNLRNLSLQGSSFKSENILVKRCWTLCSKTLSLT